MKNRLKWSMLTLVLAVFFHLVTVAFLPRAIMAVVSKKALRSLNVSVNTAVHQPPVSADQKTVVMPCPDLLYTLCVYDVSRRPLRIKTPAPDDTYFSIAMYASNTDNFFVVNDRMLSRGGKEIILIKKGSSYPHPGQDEIVEAPTSTGIILGRTLITDENKMSEITQIQHQIKITQIQ